MCTKLERTASAISAFKSHLCSPRGTPGKLGDSQDQQAVRQDILKADVRQLEQTLNRDLVIPYVDFNFGRQEKYPKLRIKYVEPKNVQLIVDSVTKLVPLGFKVKAQEMHALLGLSAAEKDDDILTAPAPYAPEMNAQNGGRQRMEADGYNGSTARTRFCLWQNSQITEF